MKVAFFARLLVVAITALSLAPVTKAYAANSVAVGTASVPATGTRAITHGPAIVPPKTSTPVPAGTAAPSAPATVGKKTAAVAAPTSATPPASPPSTAKVFKHGECPLTRDSSGVWRGPDNNAVDAATANMGDCKK